MSSKYTHLRLPSLASHRALTYKPPNPVHLLDSFVSSLYYALNNSVADMPIPDENIMSRGRIFLSPDSLVISTQNELIVNGCGRPRNSTPAHDWIYAEIRGYILDSPSNSDDYPESPDEAEENGVSGNAVGSRVSGSVAVVAVVATPSHEAKLRVFFGHAGIEAETGTRPKDCFHFVAKASMFVDDAFYFPYSFSVLFSFLFFSFVLISFLLLAPPLAPHPSLQTNEGRRLDWSIMAPITIVDGAATAPSPFPPRPAITPLTLAAIAAVLLVLAYPFFPSPLATPKNVGLNPAALFYHFPDLIRCFSGNEEREELAQNFFLCLLLPLVSGPILVVSYSVGPRRESFTHATVWTWYSVVCALFRLIEYVILNNPAYAFMIAVGIGLRIVHGFLKLPRQVRCENGAPEDFDPVWSYMPFLVVLVGCPTLSFKAAVNRILYKLDTVIASVQPVGRMVEGSKYTTRLCRNDLILYEVIQQSWFHAKLHLALLAQPAIVKHAACLFVLAAAVSDVAEELVDWPSMPIFQGRINYGT
ncbi:hypothetical protein ACRALDRAFT_210582 [Sodiomyces alcalophilus JCM 7366]|uniref:uncharacterized protein n=1 Tax=Sodiomyces alcalophilus JCM 7366 TaxID=591952 RepID=UPI0039B57D9D